ncbi:atrial natriuretic peptide receptor 1-like [Pecten maximus]|uniref:atrial natriuretic peptide receptor 1-like n=1 Tax=Pecten maximus TaxID=6579 RepID=UPI0014582392|nr:atrial natriuretic peptide receptor 1-like [Pecten maximus]
MDYRLLVTLIYGIFRVSNSWHQFSNTQYHCWPLSANGANPQTYDPCPGVDLTWIEPPPDTLKEQAGFNTTSQLFLQPSFYSWAVGQNLFSNANGSQGISDASLAQQWCETTTCPSASVATEDNCCIHHMNIHSCPMDGSLDVCGPWIPPSGKVFTHSQVLVGSATQGNWTNYVGGLYVAGQTSIIAHFKVAGISIALIKIVKVLPKAVCGDGNCEPEEGCETCVADCGTCPLEPWAWAVITLGILAVVVVFGGLLLKIQYQKRKLLFDESWIYLYDTIIQELEPRHAFGSCISRRSMACLDDAISTTGSLTACKQMFATTGTVDGKTVTIRKINKNQFLLSRRIREEVRIVRTMDHTNLCKFVGGCVKVPNVCILMEYCLKGSLIDVLLNDDIPLSWSFRLSFAADIARGMAYLHNHSIVHGRLKAHNCVIDDRWTVKITDYGLPTYRINEFEDQEHEGEITLKMSRYKVYYAPEFKNDMASSKEFTLNVTSCEGDVYAFGVILIEIATRNDAYGDEDWTTLPLNWKPPIPQFGKHEDYDTKCPCPEQYCSLIVTCLNNNQNERPKFDIIKKSIHKMNPNKLNPVDLMMNMMEKYSKHLESLVTDRTKELILEKQKTDRLLYNILPKSVADELRHGRPVQAESFEICTIFFSDIVGFTSLSCGSTPMEVVALLNKLYITFDEIIEKFDVYKVETIGDAYMVVSGVPNLTEDHAYEISNMALELVEESKIFTIPHRKGENLKIRVGLHSGHVCAGVVGMRMPRYCLFGDTVNTASRMESNGEAYRIHISDSTHTELALYDGFVFEERGTIPIKGKGNMRTWWLLSAGKTKKCEKLGKIIDDTNILTDELLAENEKNSNLIDQNSIDNKTGKQNGNVDGCISMLKTLNSKLVVDTNMEQTGTQPPQKGVRFE